MLKAQTIQKKSKPNNHSPFQNGNKSSVFIQSKLNIGKTDDKFEKEADRMANTIISKKDDQSSPFFNPATQIQKLSNDFKNQEEEIQEKALTSVESVVAQKETEEEKQLMKKEDVVDEFQEKKIEEELVGGKKLLQKSEESDMDVEEEPLPVQAKTNGSGVRDSSIESQLSSSKGGGSSLPGETKTQMESGFGADFSDVRLHTDSNAVQMSKNIGAQAFTHGSDIYFNEGKYQPKSDSGKHLLAHELTHTVQQGASVQSKMIQKENDDSEDLIPSTKYENSEKGTIDTEEKRVTIPSLPVPSFKVPFGPSRIVIPKGGFAREDKHIPEWEKDAMAGKAFSQKFTDYAAQSDAPELFFKGTPVYYLVLKEGGNKKSEQSENNSGVIFGSLSDIKRRVSRPYWTGGGNYKPYDVDHKVEIQIGGAETETSNMWMLESSANRSSGALINNSKKNKIEDLLKSGKESLINSPNSYDEVKEEYEVIFEKGVEDTKIDVAGDPSQNWELKDIQEGKQLEGLKFLSEGEVEASGIRGSGEDGVPKEIVLYTGLTGGLPIRVPWDEEAVANGGRKDALNIFIGKRGGSRVVINSVVYNSSTGEDTFGGTGTIICSFPLEENLIERRTNLAYSVRPIPGVSYGGYIEKSSVLQAALHALEFKYLSPITLNEAELDDDIGLKASGTIKPTIPLLGDVEIDIIIDEQGARLRKLFQKSDFNFPAPFEITESSLEVFAGTEGFGINGKIDFGITNVGEGYVGAAASTGGGFELEGAFNFDSELFDPAEISVEYRDDIWSIGGTIGIPENKVRGIKSATIAAEYSENTFTANGEGELDIPGIQRGQMEVIYGEDGFSISGDFELKDDIPGIKGGSVSAVVSKQADEEGYSVQVEGVAQPDIPGIDTSLSVIYDNGALIIEGNAAYSRGMLSGNIKIGASNRIFEDGQPTEKIDDKMRVYGGGDLTLQLTPWLQATAGVQFLPNGEIEIVGKIALPDTVDVFNRKEFQKNLFSIPTIEIPLFAIPLGPRSIGLVAQIDGGLAFSAGFGPGQLRDVYAEVTYNPDREDETVIHGHGIFAIPADAGLTLSASLGLGLSVTIASLTGGIELSGTLGLAGEAAAEADLSWSPTTGVVLDAEGRITVNPKFTFDVNAFARAKLGIGILSISETWRHNLASFSWGPDIQFGIIFPVHYEESQPFDIGYNDIELIYPDIKVVDMAIGMAKNIKDQIF